VPQSVVATALSCSDIKVSWQAASDTGGSGLFGYRVYDAATGGVLGTVTSVTASFAGLAASTNYSFQISAIDKDGNESARSDVASATTPACCLRPRAMSGPRWAGWYPASGERLASVRRRRTIGKWRESISIPTGSIWRRTRRTRMRSRSTPPRFPTAITRSEPWPSTPRATSRGGAATAE
jgi:hypothetical protein